MKPFVIGGLDTPEKKQEAEAILKGLGCVDDEKWNLETRDEEGFTFIRAYEYYSYHNHDCQKTPITLEDLRTMKTQEK